MKGNISTARNQGPVSICAPALADEATCRSYRQVREDGNRQVAREIPFHDFDMIISQGRLSEKREIGKIEKNREKLNFSLFFCVWS